MHSGSLEGQAGPQGGFLYRSYRGPLLRLPCIATPCCTLSRELTSILFSGRTILAVPYAFHSL